MHWEYTPRKVVMKTLQYLILCGLFTLPSDAAEAAQAPLGPQSVGITGTRTAFTPEFSASVERYLAHHRVPGLSAGVVYVNGTTVETEYGTWGNRTEDGDAMSKEVRMPVRSQPADYSQ